MPSPVVRRYVSWNTSGCASRLPHRTVDTRTSWAPQGSSCAWGIVNDHVLGASCISRGEHSCKGFFGDWHREMAWEGLTTPIKERKLPLRHISKARCTGVSLKYQHSRRGKTGEWQVQSWPGPHVNSSVKTTRAEAGTQWQIPVCERPRVPSPLPE